MRNNTTVALTLWSMLVLAGCATTDDVLFVTKTSLGIDFDSKPASASIAYDRTEGYIAPRYDNGEIPPVVASIKSDAKIFNPKISQVYATGDAAVIAVSECPKVTLAALDPKGPTDTKDGSDKNDCPKVTPPTTPYTQKKLKGEKKLMFFGTTTTTGMKVGFTTYVPDSFVFGFRRKEYSFIPLGTERIYEAVPSTDACKAICASWNEEKTKVSGCSCVKEEYDVYPSVLASIDTAANAGELKQPDMPESATSQSPEPETASTQPASQPNQDKQTSLSHSQFFATGRAARELAANPAISKAFKAQAVRSLGAEQQAEIVWKENEKIAEIVAFFTDTTGELKKTELDSCVSHLIETDGIDANAGNRLKTQVKTREQLEDLLKKSFDKLGKPLSENLNENCKAGDGNVGNGN